MKWMGFSFRKKTQKEIEAPKPEPPAALYKTALDVALEFSDKLHFDITTNEFREILSGSNLDVSGNCPFFALLVSSKAIKELNDRIEKLEAEKCKTNPKT